MKITIVAGARPNFIKIAPLIHAIHKHGGNNIAYRLVHTGQHYDKNLSDTFFEELHIPQPDVNLGVGSGSQATQTANIMIKFEEELLKNPTDFVIVVGDVNSTLACSVVAKKLNTKLIHIEAGIRSFDMTMPEEINRMVTDALADYYFTPSEYANNNLLKNGVEHNRIFFVGNIMIDSLQSNISKFTKPEVWNEHHLQEKRYWVLTLHRPSNVDDEQELLHILQMIDAHSSTLPIIFPVHPRTENQLKHTRIKFHNILNIHPMSYLRFMYLVQHALGVITDSGGIQEETTVMNIPCLTLRKNTERPETVSIGSNELISNLDLLPGAMKNIAAGQWKKSGIPKFWDGNTADRIVEILLSQLSTNEDKNR
jgi:UDP-N-acetylglucosamine 2-epimerase (non-hydrolysing)